MSDDASSTEMPGEGQREPRLPGGSALQSIGAAGADPDESTKKKPSVAFLAVVAFLSLTADLATKWWAVETFDSPFKRIHVIKGYAALILAENRGGAWGLLQNESEALRRPFFLTISVVAVVFIVSLYRKLSPQQTALKWGLPLVLGGALGNLIDRIRYGHVIDFIDLYATWGGKEHHWPTFNIADIAIVAGVILMAVDMFTPRRRSENKAADTRRSDTQEAAAAHPPDN